LPERPDVVFEAVHASIPDADTEIQDVGAKSVTPPARGRRKRAPSTPSPTASLIPDMRFLRFRPPRLEATAEGLTLSLPHIRLDRALDFLIGDKLA
jgi:predicted YcjX-like family ATPase